MGWMYRHYYAPIFDWLTDRGLMSQEGRARDYVVAVAASSAMPVALAWAVFWVLAR